MESDVSLARLLLDNEFRKSAVEVILQIVNDRIDREEKEEFHLQRKE